jgi:hypothetical protein
LDIVLSVVAPAPIPTITMLRLYVVKTFEDTFCLFFKISIPNHLFSLIRNSLTHSEIAMTEEQLSLVIHLLKRCELEDIAEVMQLSGRLKFGW